MKKILFIYLVLIMSIPSLNSQVKYKQPYPIKTMKYLDSLGFDIYHIPGYYNPNSDTMSINSFNCANFIDSLNGLMLSGDKVNNGVCSGFFKTVDNGKNWTYFFPYSKLDTCTANHSPQPATNFNYLSKDNIIVLTSWDNENARIQQTESELTFFITRNGGESWQLNKFSKLDKNEWARDFDIINNGYGVMLSDETFYSTDDYFSNISKISLDDSLKKIVNIFQNTYFGSDEKPCKIKIFNDKSFIIGISRGHYDLAYFDTNYTVILKTNNELKSYQIAKFLPPSFSNYFNCRSIDILDSNKIWLLGNYFTFADSIMHYVAYYTHDFGETWQKKFDVKTDFKFPYLGFYPLLQSIKFKDDSTGIIVGSNSIAYLTNDGGNSWKNLLPNCPIEDSTYYNYFGKNINSYTIWFVDACFKPDNNILFSTFGTSDIITYKMHPDTSITSVQDFPQINTKQTIVCPNPVQDILTIINLPNDFDYNTTIEIYNIYGLKQIEVPYTDKIDVSKLSTGVYYLKINNQFTKFVKFMK